MPSTPFPLSSLALPKTPNQASTSGDTQEPPDAPPTVLRCPLRLHPAAPPAVPLPAEASRVVGWPAISSLSSSSLSDRLRLLLRRRLLLSCSGSRPSRLAEWRGSCNAVGQGTRGSGDVTARGNRGSSMEPCSLRDTSNLVLRTTSSPQRGCGASPCCRPQCQAAAAGQRARPGVRSRCFCCRLRGPEHPGRARQPAVPSCRCCLQSGLPRPGGAGAGAVLHQEAALGCQTARALHGDQRQGAQLMEGSRHQGPVVEHPQPVLPPPPPAALPPAVPAAASALE